MQHQPVLKMLVLKTADLERLREFYALFGFELAEEKHGNGPRHYSAPMGDGVLELYPLPEGAAADLTSRFGFAVSDLRNVVESVRSLTEMVIEPKLTEWGLRAVVRDPDGRTIELYEC